MRVLIQDKSVIKYFGNSLIKNQQDFSHSTLKACLILGVSAANESLS